MNNDAEEMIGNVSHQSNSAVGTTQGQSKKYFFRMKNVSFNIFFAFSKLNYIQYSIFINIFLTFIKNNAFNFKMIIFNYYHDCKRGFSFSFN